MATEGAANDEQITEAIMMRVVKDELKEVSSEIELPEPKPLPAKDEQLTTQLAQTIKIIGDDLAKHKPLNDTIDGLMAKILESPQDKSVYQKLVTQVFADGINWGRIVVFIYTIAKLVRKLLLANLPSPITEIISWMLNYFKQHLLNWVLNMGGWICSIASIACFRMESVPVLYPPEQGTLPVFGIVCFAGGIVLGACAVLWLTGRSKH